MLRLHPLQRRAPTGTRRVDGGREVLSREHFHVECSSGPMIDLSAAGTFVPGLQASEGPSGVGKGFPHPFPAQPKMWD